MNARWARKKTTTGTAIAMIAAAWISVGSCEYRALKLAMPTESGWQLGLALQVDQRQEVVVPGPEEVEQADRHDGRDRLREDDRPQHPERARTIDHGRLVQVPRDRHEVLAQQEDVVGVGEEVGDDQRQPGAGPAERGEDERRSGSG